MMSVRFAAPAAVYNPGEETVLIVDEENQPVGSASRREMRAGRLLHRATFVYILNSQYTLDRQELYVQQRVETKDLYPGYLDPATGGVVLASDDTMTAAALRELEEEMGIREVPLQPVGDIYYEDEHNRVWGAVFVTHWNGDVLIQPEEVADVKLIRVKEVLDRAAAGDKFSPDSVAILRKIVDSGQLPVEA